MKWSCGANTAAVVPAVCFNVFYCVLMCFNVFYCADSDPAEVYTTVRTEDISYGPIIIKDRKKTSKTEGTAALLCLYQDSLLQPETEASCYSGYEDEKIFGIIKNETTINDFKTLPIFDATYNL